MKTKPPDTCPCGSGQPLSLCCGPYLEGLAAAPTAAALMRSRYTAYTLAHTAYVAATWHPDSRPADLCLDQDAPTRWLGLEVKRHETQGDQALVEFVARYKIDGKAYRMHEISRFTRLDGRWYYLDGDVK